MSYLHPLTRSGRSSIVHRPPHYYAVDYIAIHLTFKDDIREVIPEELEAEGEGWVYIGDFVSVSNENWEYIYLDPYLTQYREGAVALKVKYKGRNYLYFPFMWVDKDWALIRGWVNGYPKKVANIEITKLHPLLEKYNEIKEGVKLGGYVVRGGSVLFKMLVNLKFKVSELPIFEFGPTLTIRYFPSTGQGERSVKEFVQVIKTNSRSSDTWKGEGSIEFGKAVNDEVELLRVKEILGGYFYRSSFKIEGTKIIGESNENSESSG